VFLNISVSLGGRQLVHPTHVPAAYGHLLEPGRILQKHRPRAAEQEPIVLPPAKAKRAT
jgi:hypothetical protein